MLSVKQKQMVPFWKGEKLPIFWYKYIFTWKCDFFWPLWPKNWKGWPDIFETFHNEKSGVLEKKPRKRKSYRGSPSCPNWVPKLWPITKQYSGSDNQWQIFFSETIQAQENGSRGTHFVKFLISNFLKGLTYSAMSYFRFDTIYFNNRIFLTIFISERGF